MSPARRSSVRPSVGLRRERTSHVLGGGLVADACRGTAEETPLTSAVESVSLSVEMVGSFAVGVHG